jgi:hypothetical protein
MGQVVVVGLDIEEVGPAHGMDVVVGHDAELVLDLAPDVVALLLHGTRRRAGVIEVEVDLGVGRDPELGEQVVDHRSAVGIEDLALDRADPQMLERVYCSRFSKQRLRE